MARAQFAYDNGVTWPELRVSLEKAGHWKSASRASEHAAPAASAVVAVPAPGATVLKGGAPIAGFRRIGTQQIRVDLVEKIARAAHDARAGRKPFVPDPALATSIGVTPDTLAKLMARLGFKSIAAEGAPQWAWRGRPQPRAKPVAVPPRDGAFAVLADLALRHG